MAQSPRQISMLLSFMRLIKALLGIVVLFLSVKYFGISFERDSWVIAVTIYTVLIFTIFGPINDTFRTKFIHLRNQSGEHHAVKAVNSLVSLQWLIAAVAILAVIIFKKPVAQLFAPAFTATEREFLEVMVLVLIPFFVLSQVSTLLTGLLNTYGSFYVPDFMAITASLLNILFIVLLSPVMGIYSLVAANIFNYLLLTVVLTVMAYRIVPGFRLFSRFRVSDALPFVIFSLPIYLATLAGQAYMSIEKIVTNTYGVGNVSLFDYARRIMDIPSLVFSSVIPVVLTPILAHHFSKSEPAEFATELRKFLRMTLLFTIPVSVVVIVCREQIGMVLFSEPNADFEAILIYMGAAINIVVLSIVAGQALIAQKRVKVYVAANIAGYAAASGLSLWLHKTVGIPYIALFYMLGLALSTLIMLFGMAIEKKSAMIGDIAKLSVLFAAVLLFCRAVDGAELFSIPNIYGYIAYTVFIGLASLVPLLAGMFVLRIDEARLIGRCLGRR